MVGPELQDVEEDENDEVDICDACSAAGCTIIKLHRVSTLYHEWAGREADKCTLAIACNSGMHEEMNIQAIDGLSNLMESWEPTIRELVIAEIPCVFTAFNQMEIQQDEAILRHIGCSVLDPGARENAFRGLMPFPEPFADEEFFYKNSWFVLFKGGSLVEHAGDENVADDD